MVPRTVERPFVVGPGGTTRPGSSTEWALRVGQPAAARAEAETLLLGGTDLEPPMYALDRPERTPAAERLGDVFASADGVVVSSPGCRSAFSNLIKNALDYAEDVRERECPYLGGRAVGALRVPSAGRSRRPPGLRPARWCMRCQPGSHNWFSTRPVFVPNGAVVDAPVAANLELLGR